MIDDRHKAAGANPSGRTAPSNVVGDATIPVPPKPGPWDGVAPERWIGRTLGKYEITGFLGKGGMAMVLRGRDPLIERDVAIKMLSPTLAGDATALARFLSEARAIGKLSHPNVVAVFDTSREQDIYYLVMELVPGGCLADRLDKQGALSVLLATKAMIDACRGVAAAHAVHLIHRDIKPANLMSAADGTVKVMDFGLAKTITDDRHLTQTGISVGTPYFMSPEQCQAAPVDFRSDVYSLGATYYCLLTSKKPYEAAGTMIQILYQHCNGPIPDPREINPAIPAACANIINRAMAKAPADRYPTVTAMLADLQALSTPFTAKPTPPAAPQPTAPTPPTPPTLLAEFNWRTALMTAGVLACVLFAAVLAWRPWTSAPTPAPAPVPPGVSAIRVGILHSQTGATAADEATSLDATRLALDEINAAGGLLGRQIEYVSADGRADADVFAREARRLIEQDKVSVLFGCWSSASRKAVLPVVEAHKHLLFYPQHYEGLETSSHIVYVGAAPNQRILPAVDWAVGALGKKRFFLIGSDDVYSHAANEIIQDYLKTRSAESVGVAYVPMNGNEIDKTVEAISSAKPDMILSTLAGASYPAFLRALRARFQSAELPMLSFHVSDHQQRRIDSKLVAGDYAASTYFQEIEGAENERFVKKMQAKHPGRKVSAPMESAYVGVKLWAQAVTKADAIDSGEVRKALADSKLAAPSGEVRFDFYTQHCYQTPRVGQMGTDGGLTIRWTAPAPIAPLPYPGSRPAEAWRAFLQNLHASWGGRWTAPTP